MSIRNARLVAFVTGFAVLALELTAFRIVAPFFGASIFITTNILAVVLGALALGYWYGGRRADALGSTSASTKQLSIVLVTAAVFTVGIALLGPSLLAWGRGAVSGAEWSFIILSLLGIAVLFFIPTFLLAMVSPWLIRLTTQQVEKAGRRAGTLYAWSTIGSLLGTFLPTLVLIPFAGSKRTLLIIAAVIALASAVVRAGKAGMASAATSVALLFFVTPQFFAPAPNVLDERETAHGYVRVVQNGRRTYLQQDEGYGIHSVYDPANILTGMNFDWFAIAPGLRKDDTDELKVGVIGSAAGTAFMQYATLYGAESAQPRNLTLTGAEIDKEVVVLAKEYFAFDSIEPKPDVQIADGRTWLTESDQQFDVLIVDAFKQLYIPSHLSTREFFEEAAEALAPGGVLVVNLNVVGEDSMVERRLSATVADVFENTIAVDVPNSFNVIFYAGNHEFSLEGLPELVPPELNAVAKQVRRDARSISKSTNTRDISTDDRPLTESAFDAMVASAVFEGLTLDNGQVRE